MKKRRLIIGGMLAVAVIAAAVAGFVLLNTNTQARDQILSQLDLEPASERFGGLIASGFIEAEEIDLASDVGGRIVALPFEEGDQIADGAVVVQLDTSLLEAQRAAAEAQLAIVQAQYDLLQAGTRDEVIAQAEAQVSIAQAAVDAAAVAVNTTYTLRNNPQDIEVQIIEAETQVQVAQHQVNAANAQLEAAQRSLNAYHEAIETIDRIRSQHTENWFEDHNIGLPGPAAYAPQDYAAAENNLEGAQSALNGTNELLTALKDLADDPQALQAQLISAGTSLETARAQLEGAEAQLANLQSGPRAEQTQMAQARIEEAQAAIDALDTMIEKMTITAPLYGIVLEQAVHVGELAVPGSPLVTFANLEVVELTVYINADQFDKVSLNQEVAVSVDSFPGRTFTGHVSHIADEAEFTPRNVQTREERVNLVYAIKIQLENPELELKPGMPADARFISS